MSQFLWVLRISLSNYLDGFQWYRKLLGGNWYLVKFQMQTHLLTFWVRRYDRDEFDLIPDLNSPYIDILKTEKY